MRTKMIMLLLCAVTALAGSASGQNAKQDFMSINKAYEQLGSLSMDIQYRLYYRNDYKKPVQNETGSIRKNGSAVYTKMFGIETLKANDYWVTIDHEDKNLSVSDAPAGSKHKMTMDTDSLLKLCSAVTSWDPGGGQKAYKLSFSKGACKTIDIIFNKKTFLISKIILVYNTEVQAEDGSMEMNPRLEITYTNINTSPVFGSDDFSIKKYVSINDKKLSAVTAYTKYELVNNTKNLK